MPAAAAHLVRASGLLPFLAAAAAAGDGAGGTGAGGSSSGGGGGGGGAWAAGCLEALLRDRIALVRRDQASAVFDSYLRAVAAVVAAALPSGGASGPAAQDAGRRAAAARGAVRLLCLLARAAPGRRELQRLQQALLAPARALALLEAAGARSRRPGARGAALQAEVQMLALLLHLPAPAPPDADAAAAAALPSAGGGGNSADGGGAGGGTDELQLAEWAVGAALAHGSDAALSLDSALGLAPREPAHAADADAPPPSCGAQLLRWLDRRRAAAAAAAAAGGAAGAPGARRVARGAWAAYAALRSQRELAATRAPLLRVLAAAAAAAGAGLEGRERAAVERALVEYEGGGGDGGGDAVIEAGEAQVAWEAAVGALRRCLFE